MHQLARDRNDLAVFELELIELQPSVGVAPMALLPEMTSVMVPEMRVPIGTATCPLIVRFDASVATNVSPARAVFEDMSDASATFSAVPPGT
ncbi:MAG: hypothetical protein WDO56_11280 [Gammaproteobacteria bacterium]